MEHTESFQKITSLKKYLMNSIVGQEAMVERLLIALLADGHLLVEGAPGLAKTKAIKKMSQVIEGDDQRIQFTPDLLPSDITGSDIYRPETSDFKFQVGPIFHNLILADEINRAPAKVQSALLEAMAEKQVTVGGRTYPLPELFIVMATQNPIEQEGTYPLPEAQLDRFLMYVRIDQPDAISERKILKIVRKEFQKDEIAYTQKILQSDIFQARKEVANVYLSDALEEYIVQIVMATRHPEFYDSSLKKYISFGASPRGTIALDRCSRALAWLSGRDFVLPSDVQNILFDVLRHRVILTFEAEAEGVTPEIFLKTIMEKVPTP